MLILDLLLHEVVRLRLHLGEDFPADVVQLLLSADGGNILRLDELQVLRQLLLPLLLLLDPLLLAAHLELQLLLFREAADREVASLAVALQVLGNVLEHRFVTHGNAGIEGLPLVHGVFRGQVVLAEDFIASLRHSRNRQHQPLLVREVLLVQVDAGLDVEGLEVVQQLVDQHELFGGLDADSENHLALLHREYLLLLDPQQLLLRDVLARLLWQVSAIAGQQLPVGCDVLQGRQMRRCARLHLLMEIKINKAEIAQI